MHAPACQRSQTVAHHPLSLSSVEHFRSADDRAALDRAVEHALVRLGERSTLETFAKETLGGRAVVTGEGAPADAVGLSDRDEEMTEDDDNDHAMAAEDEFDASRGLARRSLPQVPLLAHVERLEAVVGSLWAGDLGPALDWTETIDSYPFGASGSDGGGRVEIGGSRSSDHGLRSAINDLQFELHKAAFLALLHGGEPFLTATTAAGIAAPATIELSRGTSSLGSTSGGGGPSPTLTDQGRALAYARAHLTAFYGRDGDGGGAMEADRSRSRYRSEIHRLLGALVFRPSSSTPTAAAAALPPVSDGIVPSPYSDLNVSFSTPAAAAAVSSALERRIRQTFAQAFDLAFLPALDRALKAGLDGGVARVEKARAVLALGGVGGSGGGGAAAAAGDGGTTTTTMTAALNAAGLPMAEAELPVSHLTPFWSCVGDVVYPPPFCLSPPPLCPSFLSLLIRRRGMSVGVKVEIPLEPVDRHHSVFVCPVSKELAIPSSSSATTTTAAVAAAGKASGTGEGSLAVPVSQATMPAAPAAAAAAAGGSSPAALQPGGGTRPSYQYQFYGLLSSAAAATAGTGTASSSSPTAPSPHLAPSPTAAAAAAASASASLAGSSNSNPAVMLKCGHTVVRESLKRLPKGSSAASRAAAAALGSGGGEGVGRAVKCAYCPMVRFCSVSPPFLPSFVPLLPGYSPVSPLSLPRSGFMPDR